MKLAQTRLVALHVVVMAKDTFLQKMEQPVLVNTETIYRGASWLKKSEFVHVFLLLFSVNVLVDMNSMFIVYIIRKLKHRNI